ncbi:PQQ-binding-like beta-propeller repeat protein [Actinoplanes awajinensis]|uniref:Serine/threonine protein kinase n=1 Tax=Actinoplanes awajinensis subsp. mycoplanecinus TaxID=135947 RepID=A0A101JIV6_9ACTN|nr:PQQ-binding-like beta-propeller repeat protein [Actinoplanes awajinensis]KUL27603.1 serine/threonine protein kinase [Actinoplanes awajinensis subsp. mycoplanecinus]
MTRVLLRASAAALLLLSTVLVGWRILRPAEVLDTTTAAYPLDVVTAPAVTGRIPVAPLIVDDRLRVYAAKNQVRADEPVYGKAVYTTRWSLRRWPEQLSGVVAEGTTVVSRWNDGQVIALDGRTGKVLWRADGPDAPDFAGHRTGAAVVWNPPGLRIAAGIVAVTEDQNLLGYDLSTGAQRFRVTLPAGCADAFTTTGGAYVCATGAYDLATGQSAANWPAGPFTPLGCQVAHSNCAGLRDAAGQGWLLGPAPRRATALDSPDATVAAGLVVSAGTGAVTASADGTAPAWSWAGQARVLGGTSTTVLLLTPEHWLVGLDVQTGAERFRYHLAFGKEDDEWDIGGLMIAEHYMAVERLRKDGPTDPESPIYYYSTDTVLMAAY